MLVAYFDIWRPGYNGATISVFIAGTTTLASLFTDEALTVAADNPQVLLSRTDDAGIGYGKFSRPLYTASPYFLKNSLGEDSGIQRPPITNMSGQDVTNSTVVVPGSSTSNTLATIVGRVIFAQNYGELIPGGEVGSAATNTATLESAIGALGTSGKVILPAGLYRTNSFSVPAGVILEGQGEDATSIQIINDEIGVTLTGDKSGFANMTLDGNNLTAGSTGVYARNRAFLLFTNFSIKNFERGLTCKGGNNPQWRNFSVLNCSYGAELHGDMDVGDTNLGGAFVGGLWDGGTVYSCDQIGIDQKFVDQGVAHVAISNIYFNSNAGTGIRTWGAQFETLNNCRWIGNHINIDIGDDATVLPPATQYRNKAMGIHVNGGIMSGGIVQATGNADDVLLEHMKLLGVTFNMVVPLWNNIILKDCFEDGLTTLTGATSQLVRQYSREEFEVAGLTTGSDATRAFGMTLEPNQYAAVELKVIGVQRNGVNKGVYHAVAGVKRAPSTLNYTAQTANFTLGDILTGATSLATARIVADSDSGATGTLSLGQIQGEFVLGEIITGSTTGSAVSNGTLVEGTHAADAVGLEHLRTPFETDAAWDIAFSFSTGEFTFQVIGNTSQTIDWTINAKVVTS